MKITYKVYDKQDGNLLAEKVFDDESGPGFHFGPFAPEEWAATIDGRWYMESFNENGNISSSYEWCHNNGSSPSWGWHQLSSGCRAGNPRRYPIDFVEVKGLPPYTLIEQMAAQKTGRNDPEWHRRKTSHDTEIIRLAEIGLIAERGGFIQISQRLTNLSDLEIKSLIDDIYRDLAAQREEQIREQKEDFERRKKEIEEKTDQDIRDFFAKEGKYAWQKTGNISRQNH